MPRVAGLFHSPAECPSWVGLSVRGLSNLTCHGDCRHPPRRPLGGDLGPACRGHLGDGRQAVADVVVVVGARAGSWLSATVGLPPRQTPLAEHLLTCEGPTASMGKTAHRSRKRTRQERRKREGNGGKPRRERERRGQRGAAEGDRARKRRGASKKEKEERAEEGRRATVRT